VATYKLIQDIEAEDKILGPLTLRQFVFALIAAGLFWICFLLVSKHAYLFLILFLPPALFFGFFALPFGRDQPTEIWFLAKLRYWFKPRQRIWNQDGIKELVTITVPKKVESVLTDGLSQTEVKSRLNALANTIDSRGWAVKNVNLNAFAAPSLMAASSDRLIDLDAIPQAVPDTDVVAADDILDETSNPVAQQFDSMIAQSSQSHRQQLMAQLNNDQPTATSDQSTDYWFMHPGQANDVPSTVPMVAAADVTNEGELTAELKARSQQSASPYGHLRTVQPLGSQAPASTPAKPGLPETAAPDPAILSLAKNNDLNVATLARQAHKTQDEDKGHNEVTIPLR